MNSVLTIANERVAQWLTMQSSVNTLGISALYLLFLWVGPRYMRGWDAFHLRETLIVYNFSMVLLNFYICKEVCYGLAAFISRVQELLWWKENLTIVQMVTMEISSTPTHGGVSDLWLI
ncbi:elongation of very long chain fatty acids protein 4b [Electrophorus electricus]|uniref:elongation of very long chain fatty acids protein 4b n=1 Tax=Electrophorus electricus TaxID=8005 RepID=UPI0015D06A1B|nr:elongation of very long chain fatty acids protein 4b [Electrophorus electricus]